VPASDAYSIVWVLARVPAGAVNRWTVEVSYRQEWKAWTDPTNALSALRLLSASPAGTNVTVTWQSVAGVSYSLERGTNLTAPFSLIAANLFGQAGRTSYTATNAASLAPLFNRVGGETEVKPCSLNRRQRRKRREAENFVLFVCFCELL